MKPLVSIVIPTKNAAGRLPTTLVSVRGQTYPRIEVLIVDNHSTDNTAEVARGLGATVLTHGGERSAQMNAGILAANGQYVYRIDDDFRLDPSLVEQAIALCEERQLDGVVTAVRTEGGSYWERVKGLERDSYIGSNLTAGVRFVRRDALAAIGGFDETLVAGEDYDLDYRLRRAGYRIGTLTTAFEYHRGEPTSLSGIARKAYFYGRTIPRYIRKYPVRSLYQFFPLRPAILRHWRRFVRSPGLAAGFLVHQLVKYVAAASGAFVAVIAGGYWPRNFPNPPPLRLPTEPRAEPPRVSVIIPTRNAAATLPRCIGSVREQTYPNLEILVVDNHSTDGTVDSARAADRVLTVGPERSTQRNAGARAATGAFLLFIDADMELTPTVVDDAIGVVEREGVQAVIVPELVRGDGFWAGVRYLEDLCYHGDDLIESPRLFTAEAFRAVGGFDERLIASEDWDLALRIRTAKFRIGRSRAHIIHHEGRVTLQRMFSKKFYYGLNLRRYITKHPFRAFRQLQPFRAAFWRKRQLLYQDPLHAVGIVILRSVETLAGGLGILVDLLRTPLAGKARTS